MEPKNQAEIVSQFLASEGVGEVVTDKVKVPALDQCFKIASLEDVRTNMVRLPLIGPATSQSKEQLGDALAQTLNYRPGKVVGISWSAGSGDANVTFAARGEVSCSLSEEQLSNLFSMILKSRANFASFNWDFSKPYVEVTYQYDPFK